MKNYPYTSAVQAVVLCFTIYLRFFSYLSFYSGKIAFLLKAVSVFLSPRHGPNHSISGICFPELSQHISLQFSSGIMFFFLWSFYKVLWKQGSPWTRADSHRRQLGHHTTTSESRNGEDKTVLKKCPSSLPDAFAGV